MYLKLLTNSNVFQYSQFIPKGFLYTKELLGVVCLDDDNGDVPMGVAVAEPAEDVLNIQWLYVLPECRRMGAGSLMLQGLTEMAEAAELGAVDVYYHSEAVTPDDSYHSDVMEPDDNYHSDIVASDDNFHLENEASDDELLAEIDPDAIERELSKPWNEFGENAGVDIFLAENGFVVMRERPIKTFALSDITSSDYVAKHNKNKDRKELKGYESISFEDISPEDEELVISQLKSQGYPDYTRFCRRDISFICKKDGVVKGCMLVTDDPDEKTLTIMILLSFMQDPLCAAKLIIVAGDKVLKLFPHDYKISFVVANENILRLVETILDDTDIVKTTGFTTHAVFEVNA